MCNPRRVTIRLSRRVSQSWQEQVTRVARQVGTATAEARITLPYTDTMTDAVRRAFERALGADDRWRPTDGGFRTDIDDGYVAYHLDTGELEVVIALRDLVTVTADHTALVDGTADEDIEAAAEETYYADVRHSRASAEAAASDAANRRLDDMARDLATPLLDRARRIAREHAADAGNEAQRAADAKAREAMERERTAREAVLQRQAEERLEGVRRQCERLADDARARAYRDVLVAMARDRGAQNLEAYTDEEGRMHIRFEVEG